MSFPLNDLYRFDEFELSRSRRTLLRNGQPVSLLPKTFEVLSCLVGNPGRVVAKEEILKSVWPESYVEENNLTQHISLLRKALTDRARFIVTIPGRGYQFTAEVAAEPQAGDGATTAQGNGGAVSGAVVNGVLHRNPENNGTAEFSPARAAARPARIALLTRAVPRWAWFPVAAVLVAAAAAAGFSAWKRWQNPPPLRKLLVADFANSTGDATFDHTLKRALEIDLEQSPYIDVMSEREAMSTLQLMGRSQDTALSPDVAREICERSNREVLLTGNILSVGQEFLLTVEAADCESGRKLTAAKAEAGSKEKVLAALDEVADRVRRGLGEPDKSMADYQVPIMQATTASLDALRSYSMGQSMDAQGKNETETLPFYQHAVELDPQFAMAYGAMANEYYNLSEPNLAAQFYKKAFDLSNRVSAKEKLILQAHYYSEGEQDMEQGINTYRQWTETYPNDWVPWVDLANDYTQIGQYAPAIAAGQQALKIQPNRAINYSVLVRALKRANRFAEARQVGAEAVRRGKDSTGLHASLYEMAMIGGDANAVAAETQWAAQNDTGWYGWYFLFLRAEAAAATGRRAQADDLFRSAWDAAERENLEEAADDIEAVQATVELSFGLPAAARAALGHLHNARADSAVLAIVRAELGDLSAAERFVAAPNTDAHPGTTMPGTTVAGTIVANVDVPRVRARLAMVRGKPLDAVAALEQARPYELATYSVPNDRAEAWLMAARPELAAAEYQKILSNRGVDPLSPLYPLAHLGVARAYLRQNKIAESRVEYERFFAEWKDADGDVPALVQARAEYARLGKANAVATK
jgi:DNA-binding winged helix-turn-helix (wHTH) protein/tetratricopeptide (TPR) repeat protein